MTWHTLPWPGQVGPSYRASDRLGPWPGKGEDRGLADPWAVTLGGARQPAPRPGETCPFLPDGPAGPSWRRGSSRAQTGEQSPRVLLGGPGPMEDGAPFSPSPSSSTAKATSASRLLGSVAGQTEQSDSEIARIVGHGHQASQGMTSALSNLSPVSRQKSEQALRGASCSELLEDEGFANSVRRCLLGGPALEGPGLQAAGPWETAVQTQPLGGQEGPPLLGDQSPWGTMAQGDHHPWGPQPTEGRVASCSQVQAGWRPRAWTSSLGHGQQAQVQGHFCATLVPGQERSWLRSAIQMCKGVRVEGEEGSASSWRFQGCGRGLPPSPVCLRGHTAPLLCHLSLCLPFPGHLSSQVRPTQEVPI